MIKLGRINSLLVASIENNVCILKDPDSSETIKLSNSDSEITQGSMLDVFVYKKKDNTLHATLEFPYAFVGEYGFLEMVGSSGLGAFFDIGLEEDLFVPRNEQSYKLERHDIYIIRICIDEATGYLYGSTNQKAHLENFPYPDLEEKHFVSLIPVERTELGYKVIINQKYLGMIYHNEIFTEVQCAELYQGVIKKIRADGLIDAALQKQGFKNVVQAKDIILEHLKQNNGKSFLTDKSPSELIKQHLGMSKKTFKNALGILYKERKVKLYKDYTLLN